MFASRTSFRRASCRLQQALFCTAESEAKITTETLYATPIIGGAQAMSSHLKPKEVVSQLDEFIIGQNDAKRAVAIALRNRWRRQQLSEDMRSEVIPKNILMIGPTGCGKTEIARRIAKLSQAPFVKVEATKYTEVGYHGKDVDQMIKDLVEISISMTRKRIKKEIMAQVAIEVEERILESLVGAHADEKQKESFKALLANGDLDDRTITVDLAGFIPKANPNGAPNAVVMDVSSNPSLVDFLKSIPKGAGGKAKSEKKKLTIKEARPIIHEQEAERMLEDYDIPSLAIKSVEDSGIVFIDEIDKLVNGSDYKGADASSEGVQRDLLPIIEGSSISTKHGNVNTDYILFICSGAFHAVKPSDLLAELQGRLPVRVTLQGLSEDDLYRILTEPTVSLIKQQTALMNSEDVSLTFTDGALREISRVAAEVNRTVENIGARRLHTVLERIVELISFDASDQAGETIVVDEEYVKSRVGDLLKGVDLRKYIL